LRLRKNLSSTINITHYQRDRGEGWLTLNLNLNLNLNLLG
jgi:hypothetical protein